MKKLGILALATPRHGGTFQYTLSMISAYELMNDVQCEIYTTKNNHEYDALKLPIVRLPNLLRIISGYVTSFVARVKRDALFDRVDMVVSPIYSTYLLMTRRPFVFTLHDLQEKYYPNNFTTIQRIWRDMTNRLLVRRAAAVICESNYVKQDIVRFFRAQEQKIFVVPAPPAITFRKNDFSSERLDRVREKYCLPQKYLFYPAQFWPHKNHLRLIRAFFRLQHKFHDCSLILTGEKRGDYGKVWGLIQELRIEDKVLHIEHIAQPDLAAIYKLACVVVIPTLFESISIPAYEAFTFGVPVCISNVVALPEQVGDAGLLFTPTSIEDMVSCLEQVLGSAALREQLIMKGRARMKKLTHKDYADRLKTVFEAVSGNGLN